MSSLQLRSFERLLGPLAEPVALDVEPDGLHLQRRGLSRAFAAAAPAHAPWESISWLARSDGALHLGLAGRDVHLRDGDAPALRAVLDAADGARPIQLRATARGLGDATGWVFIGRGGVAFVGAHARPLSLPRPHAYLRWTDRTTLSAHPGGTVRLRGTARGLELRFASATEARAAIDHLRRFLLVGHERPPAAPSTTDEALTLPVLWEGSDRGWCRGWLQATDAALQLRDARSVGAPGDGRSGRVARWSAGEITLQLPDTPGEPLKLHTPSGAQRVWAPGDALRTEVLCRLQAAGFQGALPDDRGAAWRRLCGRWRSVSIHRGGDLQQRGPAVLARLDDQLILAWRAHPAPLPMGAAVTLELVRDRQRIRGRVQLGPILPVEALPPAARRRMGDARAVHLRAIRPLPGPPEQTPRRRRHHRSAISRPATLRVRGPGSTPRAVVLRDLSISGAAVAGRLPRVEPGAAVELEFEGPHAQRLRVRGAISRVGSAGAGGSLLAIHFAPQPARTETVLASLVTQVDRSGRAAAS
jgi:hypothetical protein